MTFDELSAALQPCPACLEHGFLDHAVTPPKPVPSRAGDFNVLPCFQCQGSGILVAEHARPAILRLKRLLRSP
jgi:hypothetical protein